MFCQFISNLLTRASTKELNEKKNKSNTGSRVSHPSDLHVWQKQSKYQAKFLLNFLNWYYILYIQQIKNQSLLVDFLILQTHLFLHEITHDQHPLCYGGKVSTKLDGRYKCDIRIQYRSYITILMLLTYVHNVSTKYQLHSQSRNNRLETFHLPGTMQVFSNITPITKYRISLQ